MVTHHKTPAHKKPNVSVKPPSKIHKIFAIGCLAKLGLTSLPNGKRTNFANLKACKPNGIPTMVMHHKSPSEKYPTALTNPVNKNHKILPIIFTLKLSFASINNTANILTLFLLYVKANLKVV